MRVLLVANHLNLELNNCHRVRVVVTEHFMVRCEIGVIQHKLSKIERYINRLVLLGNML